MRLAIVIYFTFLVTSVSARDNDALAVKILDWQHLEIFHPLTRSQSVILAPQQEVVIKLRSNRKKVVGFRFEVGSQSWDEMSDCPVSEEFGSANCGWIEDEYFRARKEKRKVNSLGPGSSVGSGVGAAITVTPIDGMVTVYLRSVAHKHMTFLVEVEDVDQKEQDNQ